MPEIKHIAAEEPRGRVCVQTPSTYRTCAGTTEVNRTPVGEGLPARARLGPERSLVGRTAGGQQHAGWTHRSCTKTKRTKHWTRCLEQLQSIYSKSGLRPERWNECEWRRRRLSPSRKLENESHEANGVAIRSNHLQAVCWRRHQDSNTHTHRQNVTVLPQLNQKLITHNSLGPELGINRWRLQAECLNRCV